MPPSGLSPDCLVGVCVVFPGAEEPNVTFLEVCKQPCTQTRPCLEALQSCWCLLDLKTQLPARENKSLSYESLTPRISPRPGDLRLLLLNCGWITSLWEVLSNSSTPG
ncbi:lysM and putative peptidoglycan-binding domain-containing protein 2 [Platysternon megacephalum]|uniref:LysM and putative peptidoglycan-binding domain-containing protein 2 n=1 Tax=Platysternon megacephalum TaxID=55544 RepID=A0A4D9EAK5_9SAUR|nr:lysM and putative peptidoglycan-binding domain-containing protein 2 [Platysternon megacephalum]